MPKPQAFLSFQERGFQKLRAYPKPQSPIILVAGKLFVKEHNWLHGTRNLSLE
jgi:hypothetical protein